MSYYEHPNFQAGDDFVEVINVPECRYRTRLRAAGHGRSIEWSIVVDGVAASSHLYDIQSRLFRTENDARANLLLAYSADCRAGLGKHICAAPRAFSDLNGCTCYWVLTGLAIPEQGAMPAQPDTVCTQSWDAMYTLIARLGSNPVGPHQLRYTLSVVDGSPTADTVEDLSSILGYYGIQARQEALERAPAKRKKQSQLTAKP